MRNLFYLIAIVLLYSCDNAAAGGAGEGVDTSNYEITDVPGAEVKRAVRRDPAGNVLEEGFLRNGVKTGAWVVYEEGGSFPSKIISYIDGKYNGAYFEFNDRGQVDLKATYLDNKLDGPWGKYRFSRPEEEAYYRNGQLDGTYKKFFVRTGKLQSTIDYKNGVQDGLYRVYNEDGQITLEYEYRNGEKVGGGIVNPEQANEPK